MSPKLKPSQTIFCVLVFVAVYPLVTGLSYLMQAIAGESNRNRGRLVAWAGEGG